MHDVPLITTIVTALALAFVFGTVAQKLKISPLVGYLLAGVMIGPGTPGYVADMNLAPQLAEIGVILLMFGVGLHFSVKDLMSVKAIAIPGAIGQIGIATLMGMGLSWAMGWTLGAGLVFGLALSVASTVVLLRALQERRLVESKRGRIAIGWLIVEDLAMVLALVLLPALGGLLGDTAGAEGTEAAAASSLSTEQLITVIAITLGKVAAFVALMLVVGTRVIPWVLHEVAHSGSRELFRLAVLAIALGVAYGAATLFGVSFALGAFFAGMVLSGSPLSHRAAEESLPLRDAFAVLFFVSVGMMFDPAILIERPLPVLATLLIIVFGKSIAAYLIVLAFGHPRSTALTISASLAQIGEFSFILAALGLNLGLLPQEGHDLVLVGAILSILLNPVMFTLIDKFGHKLEPAVADPAAPAAPEPTREPIPATGLTDHAIIIGHGRVGSLISAKLRDEGVPYLVVEDSQKRIDSLREQGVEVVVGNAVLPDVLSALNLPGARLMFIAIPGSFEAGQIIRQTRVARPSLPIIARAHADEEVIYLTQNGASTVVMGERETARGMIAEGLASMPPAATAIPAIDLLVEMDVPPPAGDQPTGPSPQPA